MAAVDGLGWREFGGYVVVVAEEDAVAVAARSVRVEYVAHNRAKIDVVAFAVAESQADSCGRVERRVE